MINIHVVFATHVGAKLSYQETMKKFLLNQTCHCVTERLLENLIKYAPPGISWLSMEILLINEDEARFCLDNPLVTPFFLLMVIENS
jgi:hypothetical protein